MSEKNPSTSNQPPSTRPGMNQEGGKASYYGVPFRGPTYPMKQDDPEHRKPQYRSEMHVRQFDLSDKDDMEAYTEIAQRVFNQTSWVSFEEKIYDDDIKSWRVLLRWGDSYYEAPKSEVLDQRASQ